MIAWMQKLDDEVEQHLRDEEQARARFQAREAARAARRRTVKYITGGMAIAWLVVAAVYCILRILGITD